MPSQTGAGDEYSEDKFRQKKAHVPRTLRMELRDTARSSKANSTFHQTLQDIHTRKYTNPDLTQRNKPAVRSAKGKSVVGDKRENSDNLFILLAVDLV